MAHLEKFFVEWAAYAESLARQGASDGGGLGRPLSSEEVARLDSDQRRQLERLREEVTDAYGGRADRR